MRNLPPVPPFPNSSATTTSHVPDSLPASQDPAADTLIELPILLLQILKGITQTLRSAFSERPPHTIQRLAELVLYPKKHYKTLPAWLRAVDRVVNVSSSAEIFPLSDTPPIVNGVNGDGGGGILWNNSDTRNGYDNNSLGSDESLGGALLTPIPWLRNGLSGGEDTALLNNGHITNANDLGDPIHISDIEDSADHLIPERADGAVTQGELMRMEQQAGVVPLAQASQEGGLARNITSEGDGLYMDEGDLVPHARGPDVVGSVDMGRVDGQDIEIHIGSPPPDSEANLTDANDAQTVLPGRASLVTTADAASATSSADSEDFEIVLKDTENVDVDAMQLDDAGENDSKQRVSTEEQDGDLVLVDADGRTGDDAASNPVDEDSPTVT